MTDLERVKGIIGAGIMEGTDGMTTLQWSALQALDAHLKEDAELLSELQEAWSTRLVEAEAELARLREALEQVTANRDSLLLRVEETEDDCRRLREDLFASRQAALSEGVRYAELLEAVKAVVRQTGPPQPRSNRDMAPPSLEAWNRLRQLIEENDG